MHNMKAKKLKGVVIKLYLLEVYDIVNWLCIRKILTHVSFDINFIRWVTSYLTLVSFALLINRAMTPLFHLKRGLRKGCPFSLLLLLLVVKRIELIVGGFKEL